MSARVIQPGETPQGTIGRLAKRLGVPAVRAATRQAMRLMGNHFVLGETIEAALQRARPRPARSQRYSFDMLGEGARTAADAERYFNSYASAIEAIGRAADDRPLPDRPGISVKLSALHPRFEAVSRRRVMTRTGAAADRSGAPRQGLRSEFHRRCRGSRPARTVARRDRGRVRATPRSRAGTVLASRSRPIRSAPSAVIDYVDDLARRAEPADDGAAGQGRLLGHRDQARAGARARRLSGVHPQGDDRPELHRLRAKTAGAAAAHLPAIRHPQRADGRDHSRTCRRRRRLRVPAPARHGRGAVRATCARIAPSIACRTYAPVGSHRDLLAYLVRRLLENGANSSFVAVAADDAVPVATLLRRPADIIGTADNARHPNIPLPRDLYRPQRQNSRGIEFGDRAALSALVVGGRRARSRLDGAEASSMRRRKQADARDRRRAREGFKHWSRTPARARARTSSNTPPICWSSARAHFIALLQREGGKTLDDALSEVREAVDFCRYYAARGPQAVRRRRDRCRDRPARAMCCGCAAAASSSRSRRGIFRWRSFSARSRRR